MVPVVEPDVGLEKTLQLLGEAQESETLDYKRTLDLELMRDRVELAKDVGAMQVDGGFIVVGADDHGVPTDDLRPARLARFDESRLRSAIRRWVPEPLDLRSQSHTIDGQHVVTIYIGPSPDGFCIFSDDGQYEAPRFLFHAEQSRRVVMENRCTRFRGQRQALDASDVGPWIAKAPVTAKHDAVAAESGQPISELFVALVPGHDADGVDEEVREAFKRGEDRLPVRPPSVRKDELQVRETLGNPHGRSSPRLTRKSTAYSACGLRSAATALGLPALFALIVALGLPVRFGWG